MPTLGSQMVPNLVNEYVRGDILAPWALTSPLSPTFGDTDLETSISVQLFYSH